MAGLCTCGVVVEDYEEGNGVVGLGEFGFYEGAEVTWVSRGEGGEGLF